MRSASCVNFLLLFVIILVTDEKFQRHPPAAIDVYLWLQWNFTAVHSPGTALFSIWKRIFRFLSTGLVPPHHIVESTLVESKELPLVDAISRFTPCDCKFCSVGSFQRCLNLDFWDAWSKRFLIFTENLQPTIPQLEEDINNLLNTYMRSQLSPFFVCKSLSFAPNQPACTNRAIQWHICSCSQAIWFVCNTSVQLPQAAHGETWQTFDL